MGKAKREKGYVEAERDHYRRRALAAETQRDKAIMALAHRIDSRLYGPVSKEIYDAAFSIAKREAGLSDG